jgi:hypothetical protein
MPDDASFAEGAKNSKTHAPVLSESESESDAGDTAARARARASASDDNGATTPITRAGGRTKRSLRPILIPPSFPSSRLLLPVMSIPTSSSSDQNTKTDLYSSSFSTTTAITLTGLPPNTAKADIRPVFQRFGEVARIHLHPDGNEANVVFVDVHGVKRTLHAYAERPIRVRGREIIVFRKSTTTNNEVVSGVHTTATPSQATQTGEARDGGVLFVSDFPPTMTQEELIEALEPFGKYDKFVMRTSFCLTLSLSLASGLF